MIRLIHSEIWKLKRYYVIWIGIATMLTVVLLTCFMEIGTPGAPTFSSFSENVIWNNFSLIFPATIVLIAGYIIERERTDDGELTLFIMIKALWQMIGMNCFVFIAVLPIIIFTGQRAGAFMPGVAFAFFYGIIGIFASGHSLTSLYPITIGLGFINYQNGNDTGIYNIPLCFTVLLILVAITTIMLFLAHDRAKIQRAKRGTV